MIEGLKARRVTATAVALMLLASTSLTACKKKEEGPTVEDLQIQINGLKSQLSEANSENEALRQVLYTYDDSLAQVDDLGSMVTLPTGVVAYNAVNDYIRLGDELEITPSSVLPNNTTINLVSGVSYKPSNNWSFTLTNGDISLMHRNGLYMTLRSYQYLGVENGFSAVSAFIEPYVSELTNMTEISTRNLFLGSSTAGGMTTLRCYVASEKDINKEQARLQQEYDDLMVYSDEMLEIQRRVEIGELMYDEEGNLIVVPTEEGEEGAEGADGETVATATSFIDGMNKRVAEKSSHNGFMLTTSLSDLVGGSGSASSEPTTQADNWGVAETQASEPETSAVETSGAEAETVEGEATETEPETEPAETVALPEEPVAGESTLELQEYRYCVGVVLDGTIAVVIEAFYPQDENAQIQEELLEAALNSLYVNNKELKSQ